MQDASILQFAVITASPQKMQSQGLAQSLLRVKVDPTKTHLTKAYSANHLYIKWLTANKCNKKKY